ncbi:hypothetical protein K492DRAFT_196581 [Lichtheimia hyalospora FSU 10163]|nr:hypothetical protein K492DRAFT_196581 [Lichtheimia hyalospora FSU 10163]
MSRSKKETAPHHSRQSRSLDNNELPSVSRQIENGDYNTPQYMNHVMSRFGHHLSAREWSLFSQSMVPMLQSSSPGSTQQRTVVSGTAAGISLSPSSLEVTKSLSTPPMVGATTYQPLLPHIRTALQQKSHSNHQENEHQNPSSSSSSSSSSSLNASKQMEWNPEESQHYSQQKDA